MNAPPIERFPVSTLLNQRELTLAHLPHEIPTRLHNALGPFVRVTQIHETWISQDIKYKLSSQRTIFFQIMVVRTEHRFGILPLLTDTRYFVKIPKAADLEKQFNQQIQTYIKEIVTINCQRLLSLRNIDGYPLNCDDEGVIQASGKHSFCFQHHLFKPWESKECLHFYGWKLKDANFFVEAVLSATILEYHKIKKIVVYADNITNIDNNDRVGFSEAFVR